MRASSTQTRSALRAPRPALQRCLSWLTATPLAVGLCLAAAPSAQALTLTDSSGNNPFYYANWVPGIYNDTGATFALTPDTDISDNSITFGSSGVSTTDAFTSAQASISYNILFSYTFVPALDADFPASAYYQICNDSNCSSVFDSGSLAATGVQPVALASGKYLRFGIDNNNTFGDLTISNFNATPVPAPLPLLGAGAAFGIIRRRRARLRAAAQAQ